MKAPIDRAESQGAFATGDKGKATGRNDSHRKCLANPSSHGTSMQQDTIGWSREGQIERSACEDATPLLASVPSGA
jgi:hypothetical protein